VYNLRVTTVFQASQDTTDDQEILVYRECLELLVFLVSPAHREQRFILRKSIKTLVQEAKGP
jgi:hypothetical protein